jgi:hypothetical protein
LSYLPQLLFVSVLIEEEVTLNPSDHEFYMKSLC